jgi:hypothetical protein
MADIPIPWAGFDPNHPSRVGAVVRHTGEMLSDHGWHCWTDITALMAAEHELQPKTVSGLLREMAKRGDLIAHDHRLASRMVRLSPQRFKRPCPGGVSEMSSTTV